MLDVAVSRTSPVAKTEGFKVFVKPLHLDEIPGAMDKMGWKIAAKLMRHWFSIKPAYVMPKAVRDGQVSPTRLPATVINNSIVKISWVRSFPSESMHNAWLDLSLNWNNFKGIGQLVNKLKMAGWIPGTQGRFQFGNKNLSVAELDANHAVNFRGFGTLLDTVNDLYGAVGTAVFKAAVVGHVIHVDKRDIFVVEGLAFYVRDTYDFNDNPGINPPLGIWNRDRVLSKVESINYTTNPAFYAAEKFRGFVSVGNEDFRRWQKVQNSGGDFIVYSDVEWIKCTATIAL